ncbi:Protein of unknown function [Kaistia soli DSM 19436]|uniref:DUF2842 domain-containing protein n=1 Tax=Kaistia soli DSM 19436 TaxID=1122133 RepID=A0A1M5KAI2_9HYPH|nr:DUF2842 domain-containing protein [Kaistia soli]SHG49479.1 Protein of unknown function [Kaistia soli DSM 19436]
MPERLRKFIGMVVLVAFVIIYALVVVTIPIQNVPGALMWLAYATAGLLWVLPAGLIIAWMQKPRPPRT